MCYYKKIPDVFHIRDFYWILRRRATQDDKPLLEQILHLFKEGFFLGSFLVLAEFSELLVKLLLFARNILRNVYANLYVEASAITLFLERPQALIAQTENAASLSASGNLDLDFITADGRDALRTAKNQLVDWNLDFAMQVVAFTAEEIVWLFGNHDEQVAASATARTAVAFATEVQVLTFAHARRNLDGNLFGFLDAAFAVAM